MEKQDWKDLGLLALAFVALAWAVLNFMEELRSLVRWK